MMISGSSISSNNYPMGHMSAMGGRPDLTEMISKVDEDGNGNLDETEAEGLAEMIRNATGEDVSVEDLMADYDEDENGLLSKAETEAALAANRPEDSPPPTGSEHKESWSTSAGIESYIKMSAMGEKMGLTMGAKNGGNNAPSFSTENFSLNTRI